MMNLGQWNRFEVVRLEERGVYLDAHEHGEILLPKYEGGEGCLIGDSLEVFIYLDSEDRLVATTRTPRLLVGEIGPMFVKDVNRAGAFLEWGLSKDLMLPFGEQKRKVSQGLTVVVAAYVDEQTGRIAATTRIGRFLGKQPRTFLEDEQVDILIVKRMTIGYNIVVEGTHWGIIYHDQIFEPIEIGQRTKGYVLTTRDDNRVDVILHKPGPEKVGTLAEQIMEKLENGDGFLSIGDRSDAIEIQAMFGVSKKTYKKALGQLYKERKVAFENGGVRLLQ